MSGSALSSFTTFFQRTTGPAYLTSPDAVINDAQLRNFEAMNILTNARREIQGGSSIKDMIFLNDPGTADTYQPGETAKITNTQSGRTIDVPWRFARVPITWTDKEIMLNEGGSSASREAQFHQFKKLRDFKYQEGFTSLCNKIERLLSQSANNAQMEQSNGEEPYSTFATITSDGLAPSGFTTVQGLNPTNESKWRSQTASYNAGTPFDQDVGVIAGFDQIAQLVNFKSPPDKKEHFTESSWRNIYVTSNREGQRLYMKAVRANNDITRAGAQDPAYAEPVFNNIPIRAVEAYDDQSQFTSGSPEFKFINGNYLKVVFHRDKWMDMGEPMTWAEKPDTTVVWVDVWFNLFNQSRQRHGYLSAA